MVRWQDYKDTPQSRNGLGRTEINTFQAMGWPKGWLADAPTVHVPVDAVDYVADYNWTEAYTLERRGGYDRVTTSVAGLEASQLMKIESVETVASLTDQPSFTQEVLSINDTDSEVWYATMGELLEQERDGTGANLAYSGQAIGAWDSSTTNYFRTWNVQTVVYGQYIYITGLRFGGFSGTSTIETHDGNAGGASKPIRYDVLNDTWTRPLPHALDGTAAGFPSARCAISEHDRIFIANMYKMSGYRYPSRVYWSTAGTSETFAATSFIEVGGDDGSEITQLLSMGDYILIFKNDKTYLLTGTDEDTFKLHMISPRFGTRTSQGAVEHKGICYFFDQSNGLITYDGSDFENVSRPINDYMLKQVSFNRESDFRVNVQKYGDRIFVSIPTDTGISDDVDRTFIYDTKLKVWTQWLFGIPSHIREAQTDHSYTGVGLAGQGDAFFGSPDGEIGMFRLEGNVSEDNPVAGDSTVSAEVHTGWVTPAPVGNRHRLRRLDLIVGADAAESNVDITAYRDFNPTDGWQTSTFEPQYALDAWHHQDVSYSDKTMFSWIQLKLIQNEGTALNGRLYGYQIASSVRDTPRGKQNNLNQAPA